MLECGHHESLLVKSVESDYQYCELCETRSRLKDALEMERSLSVEVKEWRREVTAIAMELVEADLPYSGDFSFRRGTAAKSVGEVLSRMSSRLRSELHRDIMNLPCNPGVEHAYGAYQRGHRDARHAAAEKVLTYGKD